MALLDWTCATICRCGDTRLAHLHYRPGTDCSGRGCACQRFRPGRAPETGVPTRPVRLVSVPCGDSAR